MRKFRIAAVLCAAFLLALSFGTVAYAGDGEEVPEEMTETAVTEANPFTPAGTGTVIDNATEGDGKELYTIMTPNENVFYLIIDQQRETENVYFLNAVTEKDLLALAKQSDDTEENESAISETSAVTPEPVPDPELAPEPESEKSDNMGMIVFVVVIVLAAGGAGYYFKIYRPKHAAAGDEYEAGEEYDEYGADGQDAYDGAEQDVEQLDDDPPWNDEDEDCSGDGEA